MASTTYSSGVCTGGLVTDTFVDSYYKHSETLKKEYGKTTYRFFLSGAPLLPITLTLTEWAMEKTLSNRTNRGGERANR